MESEEDAEEYNTSEVDWGEETDPAYWDDGDDHTEGHWYIDYNLEYVPDDEEEFQEVEPEPTDQYSTCLCPKSQRIYEDSSDGEFYVQACPRRMKNTAAAPSRSFHGNQSAMSKANNGTTMVISLGRIAWIHQLCTFHVIRKDQVHI
uniref:Uncharacterized protein n=1 Tax=Brassica campestris TaxID=3711 RepID=M4F5M7_BRACM